MIPIKENEFFKFMRNRHDLLLTSDEIDEIEDKILKGNDMKEFWIYEIRDRISLYRLVSLFWLVLAGLIGWEFGMRFIILLFVIYNLISFFRERWLMAKYRKRNKRND